MERILFTALALMLVSFCVKPDMHCYNIYIGGGKVQVCNPSGICIYEGRWEGDANHIEEAITADNL